MKGRLQFLAVTHVIAATFLILFQRSYKVMFWPFKLPR
jgi:hypothetical protein